MDIFHQAPVCSIEFIIAGGNCNVHPLPPSAMGGYEEGMDDAVRAQAEEAAEREEMDYRLSTPHCACQSELAWNARISAWTCLNNTCEYFHI
ncbi:MAG: hypothetical protein CXT68_05745 [Methanobacteriota archaeon]|nr:MAG: hypothetical protein CXT68_05745 [Euryarchaeota archaeon]